MKINNENENYTIHFIFHTKYSTYQIFMDICNEKNIKSTCQDTKHHT